MAKIFGIDGGYNVPSLSQAISPTLNVPFMEFDSISSALDNYATKEESDVANAEENFNNIVEFHDKVIGEKFDNTRQRDVFERARKDIGIDDNAFKVSMNDLRDDYKMRSIRSKVGQIYERADVKEVLFEQKRGNEFLDYVYKLKDMNPALYKKALSQYNKYRNGDVSGFSLLPQEYTPIDVTSTIAKSLELIPQIDTSDLKTKHGYVYEEIVKQRSKKAIQSVMDNLNNNAIFKNNLEAMFTKPDGTYDEAAAKAYVDKIAGEYAKQYIDIENVKEITPPKATTEAESKLTNITNDISKRGGSAEEILKNQAVLEQIVDGKSLIGLDEDDESVLIKYLGPDKVEKTLSIPKTTASTAQAPLEYTMNVGANKKTVSGEDVKSYVTRHPKVREENQGPDGAEENKGQDTKAYIKDGYLYTNDVGLLWELGIVKDGTDFDELDDYGFEFQKTEDNRTLAKIKVSSNKSSAVVPQTSSVVPNKQEIDDKLDSNPVISQYGKDSEKYSTAEMFLSSPELQDGYFQDVYMKEDYQEYLDSVKSVAPLEDNGYFDISEVHDDLKPLLKTNAEEKLKYLAHHHALASGGFLRTGKAKIEGNSNADAELKAAWKRIDEIVSKNPGMGFIELLKAVESGNSYDAVYSGSAHSSAIGKYQILFDTHFNKIKKYIQNNPNKVLKAGGTPTKKEPVAETKVDSTEATPFDEDFNNE